MRVETEKPLLTRWLLRPPMGTGVEKRSSQMTVRGVLRLVSVTTPAWGSTSMGV
ncbi:hypothetical protein D3C72_2359870 [compost metagenome]